MDRPTRRQFLPQTLGAGSVAQYQIPGIFARNWSERLDRPKAHFILIICRPVTDNDLLVLSSIHRRSGHHPSDGPHSGSFTGGPVHQRHRQSRSGRSTMAPTSIQGLQSPEEDTNFQGFGWFLTGSTGE
ncbi:MAG: hypothetical protein IPM55_23970 [Acidobacteria bacterium]|nr:hypothetical protein [Acidobacteriota bacterium]